MAEIIMTLDRRDLKVFLAVEQFGSVRAAAEHLALAPSMISRSISQIEAQLGVDLFERTPRGMALSDAGAIVLEHARRMREEADLLSEQLETLRGLEKREVRLHCGEGFVADFVQNGLARLMLDHPKLRFTLQIGSTEAVAQAVASGESDLGIAYSPPLRAALRSMATARHPLCVVLPLGHPLAARGEVTLQDCLAYPLALMPKGHGTRDLLTRVASDMGLALQPRLVTTSIFAMRSFVSAGLGLTFLPRASVAMDLAAGTLGVQPLADAPLALASAELMVRARRRLPRSVALVAECLAGQMASFGSVAQTATPHS